MAVLLSLLAFFTAVETAMLSLNRYRLRSLVTELDPQAILVNKLLNDSSKFMDTINYGISILKIVLAVIGASQAFSLFGDAKGTLYAILILVFVIVIFAEVLPRAVAQKSPEKTSLFFVRFIPVMLVVLYPIVLFFNIFRKIFETILGVNVQESNGVTEEEIIELVAVGQEDGTIHQEEKTMINGVFDFTDTMVRDVMIPRTDIVAVERYTSLPELMDIIKKEQFSRIPVYEKNIDNILGVVHIKDLIMTDACEKEDFTVDYYLRPTIFLPETKKVNDLFKTMKKEKIHLCIVLDEYGGTAGLLTMEDLIEEIMGDIQDEHDTEEPDYNRIDEYIVEVNASIRIEELNEKLGMNLECEDAETVGGIVFAILGRIPVEGDQVIVNSIKLEVILMEGHRIEKIRLTKLETDEVSE
jgi:putative hemolysin